MLNCIAEFTGSDSNKSRCGNGVQRTITSTCQRLTADLYAGIINNYYMKPSHKKPYYYIILLWIMKLKKVVIVLIILKQRMENIDFMH